MLALLYLLPVLALASPTLHRRDDTAIVQALADVDNKLAAVNTALDDFDGRGDTITGIKIHFLADTLTKSVQSAASVCDSSEPLDETQSQNVASAVLQLQPHINSTLDNVVAHKTQFDSVIFGFSASPIVKLDLQDAKKATDALGAALIPKLSSALQDAAPIVIQQIDAKFDEAIAAFS